MPGRPGRHRGALRHRADAAVPPHGGARQLRAVLQGADPGGADRRHLDVHRLRRGQAGAPGRILHRAADLRLRHVLHGLGQQPADGLPRPGTGEPYLLHPHRHAAAQPALRGGRAQVPHLRRGRLRHHDLRHELGVRHGRQPGLRRHQRGHGPGRRQPDRPVHRLRLHPGRLRLQDGLRALPHVVAGRVPGGADALHRLSLGGLQRRGSGHPDPLLLPCGVHPGAGGKLDVPGVLRGPVDRPAGGPQHRHHDLGQPLGPQPEQRQAPAGLFRHRPRRLHHDGTRGAEQRRPHRHVVLRGGLPDHEPGGFPGGHGGGQRHRPGRHGGLPRPGAARRGLPGGVHGGFPVLADGAAAPGRIHRQAAALRRHH